MGFLEWFFYMVSKDIWDKFFNVEVKKCVKEVIKWLVWIGDMEVFFIMVFRSVWKVVEVEGFEKEFELKEVDLIFKDLELLFYLYLLLYSCVELMIGFNGFLWLEMIDFLFFVVGLNYMDMFKFV